MSSTPDERSAKYACDTCKSKKVTCSRERSGCQRCGKAGNECIYSRSGVIRRSRRRKHEVPLVGSPSSTKTSVKGASIVMDTDGAGDAGLPSPLMAQIEETRVRLSGLDTPKQDSCLKALSSLYKSGMINSIGPDVSRLDAVDGALFLPNEHALEWAQEFETLFARGGPLMCKPPPVVYDHLRAARPHRVRERAWLVMYYALLLNKVTSAPLKKKLGRSLWLALSDVRVLIEPSEANIQALVFALSRASELTGPLLCWMMATSACRMLQALGINRRGLDRQTRERRLLRFWHLNLLDKGLAIIFGRTPTFHRQMVRDLGLPKLEQIQTFASHVTLNGAPGFFGPHFMYQKILLSHLMDDIWNCIYGEEKSNEVSIKRASNDLESWYEQATRILEAAALSEKPFCDARNANSVDVALRTVDFHFLHLSILLTQASVHERERCLDASKRMLRLLQHMAPESSEPYHPIIWQLVCCPFTPFLILFRDILSPGNRNSSENKEALAAMECLPKYLKDMEARSHFAAKLGDVAKDIVEYIRSVLCNASCSPLDGGTSEVQSSNPSLGAFLASWPSDMDTLHLPSSSANDSLMVPTTAHSESSDANIGLNGPLRMFMDNLDSDGMLDWLNWES